MVTDRCSTAALLVILALFYPDYALGFMALNALDMVSHWNQMYSSLSMGAKSHKDMNTNKPWLLRQYYTNRQLLAFACAGNDGFYWVSLRVYAR